MDYLEKVIEFHGDKLLTLKEEKTGKIFISVKHVCDGLKMSHELYRTQKNKINKDVFLKGGTKLCPLETNGGIQQVLMIELDYLPAWLFKINPARFDEELRKKLLDYQLHCKDILADEFFGKRNKLEDKSNFNEYNEEIKDRLNEADRLENKIRELCILLINEYNMISWRSDQSKERIEKVYKSLKGNKITEDGKELDFKAINELNNQNYEIIRRKLNE